MKTKIAWTQHSVNPIGGCDKKMVSAGCANCYALRMARRQAAIGQKRYEGLTDANGWTGKTFFHPKALKAFKRKEPTEFFVVSMGDLYAASVKKEWAAEVWAAMGCNPQHKYLILTKRYKAMYKDLWNVADDCENVFPGFSVCNEHDLALARGYIARMLDAGWPLWLSIEPCLGLIHLYKLPVAGVVCGGESGPGARPMDPTWARSLRDQCAEMGISFFFKQWGGHIPLGECCGGPNAARLCYPYKYNQDDEGVCDITMPDGSTRKAGRSLCGKETMFRVPKELSGRILDGQTHNDLPWRQ